MKLNNRHSFSTLAAECIAKWTFASRQPLSSEVHGSLGECIETYSNLESNIGDWHRAWSGLIPQSAKTRLCIALLGIENAKLAVREGFIALHRLQITVISIMQLDVWFLPHRVTIRKLAAIESTDKSFQRAHTSFLDGNEKSMPEFNSPWNPVCVTVSIAYWRIQLAKSPSCSILVPVVTPTCFTATFYRRRQAVNPTQLRVVCRTLNGNGSTPRTPIFSLLCHGVGYL